jgi:hypothetical protein
MRIDKEDARVSAIITELVEKNRKDLEKERSVGEAQS